MGRANASNVKRAPCPGGHDATPVTHRHLFRYHG